MYNFTLLIEKKEHALEVLNERKHEIIDTIPHYEVMFEVESFQELEAVYWDVTRKLKALGVHYVISEDFNLPV
ncbi:hypothetical protein V6R21_16305 [Limibacter armeniacum]|uniref:hypothetical protein n=1 Tax=Limibacter armeniacum TaxID=466084 RepID=UPI002FE64D95